MLLSQTCDVFTQNSFGVGDVLGDQLLISVLSGGNQLQQDFDVLSLGSLGLAITLGGCYAPALRMVPAPPRVRTSNWRIPAHGDRAQ